MNTRGSRFLHRRPPDLILLLALYFSDLKVEFIAHKQIQVLVIFRGSQTIKFFSLKFYCFMWYCLCEIKKNCVRHKALHWRHRNNVTDRNAHALKQLAWTKHFTTDTEPRKTTRSRALRHVWNISSFVYIIVVFYFRMFFCYGWIRVSGPVSCLSYPEDLYKQLCWMRY